VTKGFLYRCKGYDLSSWNFFLSKLKAEVTSSILNVEIHSENPYSTSFLSWMPKATPLFHPVFLPLPPSPKESALPFAAYMLPTGLLHFNIEV
jgi:hypothetical protein